MTDLDLDTNLNEKNEGIKGKLQGALSTFKEEQKADKKGFKKFGYRMTMQIDNQLRKEGLMSSEQFAMLDYNDIECYWNKFRDLIAFYNLYFEIVANKQLFMAYMGINNRMYKQLEKNQDEDVRDLMMSINDSFIGLGFSASENGNVDSKAVTIRLGANDVGHEVVSATNERMIATVADKTPEDMEKLIKRITGGEIKKLN